MSDEQNPNTGETDNQMSEEDRLIQELEREEAEKKVSAEAKTEEASVSDEQTKAPETKETDSKAESKQASKAAGSKSNKQDNSGSSQTKTETAAASVEAKNFQPNTDSQELRAFVHQLDEYIDARNPRRRMNRQQLLSAQRQFDSLLRTMFSYSQRRFNEAMKVLIGAVREHRKGVFHESRCLAGVNELPINRSGRQRMEMMANMLLAAADSQNPRDISHTVNLEVALRYFPQGNQDLLRGFFNG